MPNCWCGRCANQRRGCWPERAGFELRNAAAEMRGSLSCALSIGPDDRPGSCPVDASPEAVDAFASGELQRWFRRLRKAGVRLRYLATMARAGDRRRSFVVLLHADRPGGLAPAELLRSWPGSASGFEVVPVTADLARFCAPRCEVVRVRASVRYGGERPLGGRSFADDGPWPRRGRPRRAKVEVPMRRATGARSSSASGR